MPSTAQNTLPFRRDTHNDAEKMWPTLQKEKVSKTLIPAHLWGWFRRGPLVAYANADGYFAPCGRRARGSGNLRRLGMDRRSEGVVEGTLGRVQAGRGVV